MGNATVTGVRAQQGLGVLGYRKVTLSAAAESSDTMAVTVTLTDAGGVTQAEAQMCIARVVGEPAADYTIAETGDGTENSVTGHAGLIFTTSAAGVATITVTDVSGGSNETVYLEVYPVGGPFSPSSTVACTFDNS
jgi:hypothetical protein